MNDHKYDDIAVGFELRVPFCSCGWVGTGATHRFDRHQQFIDHLKDLRGWAGMGGTEEDSE